MKLGTGLSVEQQSVCKSVEQANGHFWAGAAGICYVHPASQLLCWFQSLIFLENQMKHPSLWLLRLHLCISVPWAFWAGCCSEAVRSQVFQTLPLQPEGSRESLCFPSATHWLLLKDVGAKSKDARMHPYGACHANTYRPSSGGPFPVEPHQLQVPKMNQTQFSSPLLNNPPHPAACWLAGHRTCKPPLPSSLLAWHHQGKCSSKRQQGGSWRRKDPSLRPLGYVK